MDYHQKFIGIPEISSGTPLKCHIFSARKMDKQIQIFLAAAGQRWHPGLLLLSRSSTKVYESRLIHDWLVVLTILKNISQWEGLSHILWKKHVWNHQPDDAHGISHAAQDTSKSGGSICPQLLFSLNLQNSMTSRPQFRPLCLSCSPSSVSPIKNSCGESNPLATGNATRTGPAGSEESWIRWFHRGCWTDECNFS